MFFFRNFIHKFLPGLILVFSTLVFCLFSFTPTVQSLEQTSILQKAGFQEMFYSASAYINPTNAEKKDSFADFSGVFILRKGKMSLASDLYMVLPNFTYDDTLPFYVSAISTLKQGECLVSKNVMELRHIKVGDTLETGVKEEPTMNVVGELPTIRGFESDHHGVVVFGFSGFLENFMRSLKPRYVNFGVRFEEFGLIKIYDSIILKRYLIEEQQRQFVPRFIAGLVVLLGVELILDLLCHHDESRMKRIIVETGGLKRHIFGHMFGYHMLYRFLPVMGLLFIFFFTNLVYIHAALGVVLSYLIALLAMHALEAFLWTWRE